MDANIKNSGVNNQIQVLRAFFCFFVVFFHFTVRYSQIYSFDSALNTMVVNYFAPFGVISFFILSGFYLIRRKPLSGIKAKSLYWVKRFLGIYAVYLVALIIIYLLSLSGLYGKDRTVSFFVFVQNVFFINIFTNAGYVDGAHWYIVSLLFLYFFGFIYDLLPKKEDDKGYFYWFFLLVFSVSSLLLKNFVFSEGIISKGLTAINLVLCNGYFPYVYIGIFFYLFEYSFWRSRKNVILTIGLICSSALIIVNDWIKLLLTIATSAIILLALKKKLSFLEKLKPLIMIGNSSYSIYLIHQNIGYMLINLFIKAINYYLSLIIVCFAIITLGLLFYYLIEKPFKKVINKIGNSRIKKTVSLN